MRYIEGQELPLASSSSDNMLLLTAVMGIVIGFILTYLGRRGKVLWLWVWGLGLVGVSIYMGVITWQNL